MSITASKPQTTRHRIGGVLSRDDAQIVFVDTPGIHRDRRSAMSRYLNRTARGAVDGVDVVVFMVEALRWTEEDEDVRRELRESRKPVLLVPNKIDRMAGRGGAAALARSVSGGGRVRGDSSPSRRRAGSRTSRPSWARSGRACRSPRRCSPPTRSPIGASASSPASSSGRSSPRKLDQELPYRLAVEIEDFRREKRILRDRGRRLGGAREPEGHRDREGWARVLKAAGAEARANMEALFGSRVHLDIWVKARGGLAERREVPPEPRP